MATLLADHKVDDMLYEAITSSILVIYANKTQIWRARKHWREGQNHTILIGLESKGFLLQAPVNTNVRKMIEHVARRYILLSGFYLSSAASQNLHAMVLSAAQFGGSRTEIRSTYYQFINSFPSGETT